MSAEYIRRLPRGSVAPEDVLPSLLDGRVIRSLRIVNPDQDEYSGLVQVVLAGACTSLFWVPAGETCGVLYFRSHVSMVFWYFRVSEHHSGR